MRDTGILFRALGERLTRLGLSCPALLDHRERAAETALSVELAGVGCGVLLWLSGAGHRLRRRALLAELRRQGRLAFAAHYAIDETELDVVIHAPIATAPRGAMQKFLDVLCQGGLMEGAGHA
jgi:hypothetical protein